MYREQLPRTIPLKFTSPDWLALGPIQPVAQRGKGSFAVVDGASPIASHPAQLGTSGKRIGHRNRAGAAQALIKGDGAIERRLGLTVPAHPGKKAAEPDQRKS